MTGDSLPKTNKTSSKSKSKQTAKSANKQKSARQQAKRSSKSTTKKSSNVKSTKQQVSGKQSKKSVKSRKSAKIDVNTMAKAIEMGRDKHYALELMVTSTASLKKNVDYKPIELGEMFVTGQCIQAIRDQKTTGLAITRVPTQRPKSADKAATSKKKSTDGKPKSRKKSK